VPLYWLDASVLIEAHQRTYPIGIADSFWEWLGGQVQAGNIVAPKRVYQEVAENKKHQDEVAKWVRHRREKGLCISPSKRVQELVGQVEKFVFTKYSAVEAWDFSRGGDAWVVAPALNSQGVVVTKESFLRPDAQKARIPDVCDQFRIKCIDTLQMLRVLKANTQALR
jgi:hypothetical protein